MGVEDQSRALAWDHGVVSVESMAGMLGMTSFLLPDGRQIAPMQVSPWANEPEAATLSGHLQRLRGEWPCVPFGTDRARAATGSWPASSPEGTVDPFQHGFGSHHHWTMGAPNSTSLDLSIAYPEGHPIASLERRIIPDPHAPALDFELVVNVRRDCDLPISLHPIVRLPIKPQAMRIEAEAPKGAMTYPGDTDTTSIFAPGEFTADWHKVLRRDGTTIDPSLVPLPAKTEELLELLGVPGTVSLWNTVEGYRVKISWNAEHFPSLMFWYTNGGRDEYPWSGRHLALGVEPVCSAFDIGTQIATQANPVSARGVATARHFAAGERFVTRYRIEVEAAPVV
jgi:hypothetical protein